MSEPRAAFLTDSFHEVNGVAHTSRQLEAYARRHGLPFFSVHAGEETRLSQEGSITRFEMMRGSLAFGLDKDLRCDPLLWRQRHSLLAHLRDFRPDVIHVTGPGDFGILGLIAARTLRVPFVASWHTNVHDYAGQRLEGALPLLPRRPRAALGRAARDLSLSATARFYREAAVLLAPNQELIEMLEERTGRPCLLMARGVDTVLFDPAKRDRADEVFTIGYVGRLTVEKNVRLLAEIDRVLREAGESEFRFLVVGQGAEREWLREHLPQADLPGVLRGEDLSRAYANMDVFVFPSETDTFGNVVLEAMASGAPAVVTSGGGPKFLVRDGETGFVTRNDNEFIAAVRDLMRDPARRRAMSLQAREQARAASWDRVFENVYRAYSAAMGAEPMPSVGRAHLAAS